MRTLTWLLLPLALTACGDNEGTNADGDGSGTEGISAYFETIRHTRAENCVGQGTEFGGADPGFRLEQDGDTLRYYTCRNANDCNEGANDAFFVQREGGIWYRFDASADILDGQACLITGFEVEFEINDAGRARFERRQYGAQANTNNPDQCQQAGESYAPEASHCVLLEVIVGAPEGETAGADGA